MTSSPSRNFKAAATQRPATFSIPLSTEERAFLEHKAGSRSLGRYIRAKLLGDNERPRKPARAPAIDYALLCHALCILNKLEQVSCIFLLLTAAEAERVRLNETERQALDEAFGNVRAVVTFQVPPGAVAAVAEIRHVRQRQINAIVFRPVQNACRISADNVMFVFRWAFSFP